MDTATDQNAASVPELDGGAHSNQQAYTDVDADGD
jgi:hypothetical protein